MVHLVERQTGGRQVLWPVLDPEVKAETSGGLETSLSLKTPEAKRPDNQIWDVQGAQTHEA